MRSARLGSFQIHGKASDNFCFVLHGIGFALKCCEGKQG